LKAHSLDLRKKVAREAATLLYFCIETEYKQAKLKAAKTMGVHFLPTNFEVAMELDKIAEENEGSSRRERLIQMRKEALKLMQIFKSNKPLLIGSVWRGTIRHNSDIDVVICHEEPNEVLKVLRQNKFQIICAQWVTVTKKGKRKDSFHIHVELPSKEKAEIKVIQDLDAFRQEKCEIYGDKITGLDLDELERLLKENPAKRFIPF